MSVTIELTPKELEIIIVALREHAVIRGDRGLDNADAKALTEKLELQRRD